MTTLRKAPSGKLIRSGATGHLAKCRRKVLFPWNVDIVGVATGCIITTIVSINYDLGFLARLGDFLFGSMQKKISGLVPGGTYQVTVETGTDENPTDAANTITLNAGGISVTSLQSNGINLFSTNTGLVTANANGEITVLSTASGGFAVTNLHCAGVRVTGIPAP